MKDGDFRGAAAHFAQAIKQGGGTAEAHLDLGSALEAGELPEEALEQYAASFDAEPSIEAAVAASYAARAMSHRREAVAWLERGLNVDPESAFVRRRIADLHLESHDFSKAAEAAREAIRFAADDADMQIWASEVLLDSGRAEEALKAAQVAQSIKPLSAEPLVQQALSLACLGRLPEAVRQLNLARDVEPQNGFIGLLISVFDPEQQSDKAESFDAIHLLRLIDRPGMPDPVLSEARRLAASSE